MKQKRALHISIGINLLLVVIVLLLTLKFNVIGLVINKINPNNIEKTILDDPYYKNKTSIFESLPNDNDEVIFVGDSITDYVEWKEFFNDKNIKNRGISGDTTEGVLNRINEIVESKPLKVFIMCGINDIGDGVDINTIEENYKKIINIITEKSPNSNIYIQSVLPCNTELMEKNNRNARRTDANILELNNRIKKLCEDSNITYIDLNKSFKDSNNELNPSYTFDGVHLNGDGYLLWQDIIKEYIYE